MSAHAVLCDVFVWTGYSCTCISNSIERYHFSANQHGCHICVEKVACKRVRLFTGGRGNRMAVSCLQSTESVFRCLSIPDSQTIRGPVVKGRPEEVSCSQRGKADRRCCCSGGPEGLNMTAARLGSPVLEEAAENRTHRCSASTKCSRVGSQIKILWTHHYRWDYSENWWGTT